MSATTQTAQAAPARPASRSPWIRGGQAYSPRGADPRARLFLDANEGKALDSEAEAVSLAMKGLCRYPSFAELEAAVAERWGVEPSRVVATAGGDDAIARVTAARLAPGAKALVYEPAFEMFGAYARGRGAGVLGVDWLEDDEFPLGATLETVERCPSLGLVCLASPANPTGGLAPRSSVLAVADACRAAGTAFLFDAAYGEYAPDDPTDELAASGSAYVVRSFSKAYGLAGLRIGYVLAPGAEEAGALRSAGMPYPSSGLAAAAALAGLADGAGLARAVARARRERAAIAGILGRLGARVGNPGANFVFARVKDPAGLAGRLAADGIVIRSYGSRPGLSDAVRVSCPCDDESLALLEGALERAREYIA